MVYKLKYSKNAAKEISKLDNLVKKKICEAVETKLVRDPLASTVKIRDFPVKGTRRFRVGKNYRVFIFVSRDVIEVLRVGHRREIYK